MIPAGKTFSPAEDVIYRDVAAGEDRMALKEAAVAPTVIRGSSTFRALMEACTRARSSSQSAPENVISSAGEDEIVSVPVRGSARVPSLKKPGTAS